jgi:hypothetical protein
MLLALLMVMSAGPKPTCEKLWPRVWSALEKHEFKGGKPDFFDRIPDAKQKLGAAWVNECKRFDAPTLSCARGEQLEEQLVMLRQQLEAEGVPPADIEAGLQKMRDEWSILDCREVNRAVDRAAQKVVDAK